MIHSMQDLVNQACNLKQKRLVVAAADDLHVIEAVNMAVKRNMVKPLLVGDQKAIIKILTELRIDQNHYQIIDEPDRVLACEKAVRLMSGGEGDILMKGFVDTAVILKAVLDKEYGLRTKNRLSHASVMEIPTYHKLLMMSDGAMNMYPDVDIKQEIIENGIKILQAIGISTPKVAMLAAIEKFNPKMPATVDAVNLIERNKQGSLKGCIVEGPFALDNAINKEAAIHKGLTGVVAGDADFIMMPQIESGNVFYKGMMFLANAKSASLIAGAQKPIVLTSRADSTESKFYSIALASFVAELNVVSV
ncbi:MAG: bifunctional enoyl-CoA hydratase/phosphate acetyltransferase [Acholeplasmataceae bacterium]